MSHSYRSSHKIIIKKKDLSILWLADDLTALPCLRSTSIHLIHYNIIDFYVSEREWSIILYLGDIKENTKGNQEQAGLEIWTILYGCL